MQMKLDASLLPLPYFNPHDHKTTVVSPPNNIGGCLCQFWIGPFLVPACASQRGSGVGSSPLYLLLAGFPPNMGCALTSMRRSSTLDKL